MWHQHTDGNVLARAANSLVKGEGKRWLRARGGSGDAAGLGQCLLQAGGAGWGHQGDRDTLPGTGLCVQSWTPPGVTSEPGQRGREVWLSPAAKRHC